MPETLSYDETVKLLAELWHTDPDLVDIIPWRISGNRTAWEAWDHNGHHLDLLRHGGSGRYDPHDCTWMDVITHELTKQEEAK